jgi:hypothetical protein
VVLSDVERNAIVAIVDELEKVAELQPQHSTTRTQMFRIAASVRQLLKGSVVTSTYRGKPVKE